jgi:tetratricopeptide (TPR) repeat protein
MGSLALSAESRKALLVELQWTYDQHRFLDAYQLSAQYWTKSTPIEELSAEELIFAARLSSRVGGMRLSRHLYRRAHEKAPKLPVVRYFTRHISGPTDLLLDQLRAFESDPDIGGDDPELRASWQAVHAYSYAILRDFSRAEDLLKQSHELFPRSAWVFSMESDVFGMADRWQDAVHSADLGCQADPRSPWPVLSLATALLNLGEVTEAVKRISLAAMDCQYFHVVQTACWYQCALAETLEGDERRRTLDEARQLAERIQSMAPLADREFSTSLARTWLDLAEMSDDHAAMERWAQEARSPFHRKVLVNLKANPSGRRIRLPYRRTIQKHVECVPTSVSSALSATGVNLSVEELAHHVTFGGTHEWAAADWLRVKGFHVRFFSATAEVTARLIEARIGFTVSWDDDESGHTVAIVGVDHAAGTVIAHDPSSFRSTEYLLSTFSLDYGPLGLFAMATVPTTHVEILDAILPPESEVAASVPAHQKALSVQGSSAGCLIVEDLEKRFPDHPGTRYLRAIQNLVDGRVGRALGGFRNLIATFPKSPAVRVRLLHACRLLGDTALLRETLRLVVDTGKVPGIDSQNEWTTAHPRYFYDYADLLRFSAEFRPKAESLLRSVLRTNWRSAGAWHVLADLRWGQRDDESALLAYRIASTLAEHNDHYASAYADVLCRSGRIDEGMEWLRGRAEKLGQSIHGVSTWITYFSMLEDWGYPERALEVCRDVVGRFGDSPSLVSFAAPFFARMGEWEEGEHWLEILESMEAKAHFHEAAVYFEQMRGLTTSALEHAEAWVGEVPLSIPARRKLLWLTSKVHGQGAALDRAAQWMRDRPENEDFEELFCEYVEFPIWRKLRVLRARAKRNPDDAWVWRELAFSVISKFESADEVHRQRLQPLILDFLKNADRLTSADATTVRAHGLWHEALGKWKEAHAAYMESIRLEPGHSWGYSRAFEVSARLSAAEQHAMWAEIEPVWLGTSGHLPNCLQIMRHLNDLFGPRETEQIIANWQKLRPSDPNVVESMADLLLDFGHGRSDALRALELLRPAVERYPYHSGLRFSLARAWRGTGDDAAAGQVFEELVRRRPDNLSALIQLAWIREREGRTDEALRILSRASKQEPQNPDPLDSRAQILIENHRFDEALAVLEDALQRLPASVRIYERTISLFVQIGEEEKAVAAARQGVQAYPRGAYLWLLLGKALRSHPQFAAPGETEACLRKSLDLNRGLYESADWLTIILTEQRRYEDALHILSEVELRVANPSPVLGRKGWIRRQAGEKREAITDLADILNRFPGYAWGWNLLLNWLEEDKEWELSRKLLGPVPGQMLANVTFRQNRLLLLEKAHAEADSLDPEWLQLLEDFPEDVPLHLHRYDSLRDVKRWEEATVTLGRVAEIADDDVYFTARLADVKCHEGRFDEALESALSVSFAPVEHSVWPVNRVWEVFGAAEKEDDLAQALRAKLKEGSQPTRRAIARYVEYLLDQERAGGFLKLLRQTRIHHVTRNILSLTKVVMSSSWRSEFHTADLFAILNTRRYPRLVIQLWNELYGDGSNADSEAWAEAGRAMATRGQYRLARDLFRDWRSRRGVRMWSLANYMQSLSRFRKSNLNEVIATCRDALANLTHDHCARYLTCMQAEACALVGDKEGLLAVWCDRRGYFGGELKKSEYFNASEKHLIHDIPEMVEALQRDDAKVYRKLLRRLRFQRLWNPSSRKEFWKIVRLVLLILILVWFIGMATGIFHR